MAVLACPETLLRDRWDRCSRRQGLLWFRPTDIDSPRGAGAVAGRGGLSLAAGCRHRRGGRLHRRFLAGGVLAGPRRSARKHSATNRFHRRPEPWVWGLPDGSTHPRPAFRKGLGELVLQTPVRPVPAVSRHHRSEERRV